MPIKGLTDTVVPAFPRLGKLRKGGEKQQKRRSDGSTYETYGKDLPYFRFTSDRADVAAAFTRAYGEQPATLQVYLPYQRIEDNFSTWKEQWKSGGMVHRCDGVTMTIWQENGKYVQGAKPCPWKDNPDHKDACKEIGRLTVILPELWKAGYVGYVTMETHSLHDIMNIQAALMATMEARGDNPMGLRGIEFTLRKSLEPVSTPRDGNRVTEQKYLVRLEPMATWASLQLQAAQQVAMGMLPAPQVVNQTTGEIVGDIEPPEDVEEGEYTEEIKPEPLRAKPVDWPKVMKALAQLDITENALPLLIGPLTPAQYSEKHGREAVEKIYRVVKAGVEDGLDITDICNALGVGAVTEWVTTRPTATIDDARSDFSAYVASYQPPEQQSLV
jgi:hypothetical protein